MDAQTQACIRQCLNEIPLLAQPALGGQAKASIGDGIAGDLTAPINDEELIAAAVLVPIISRPNGLSILLTKRSDNLEKHAGQVSLPGGQVEDSDNGYVATALRETEEETGIKREYITVLGGLDECRTGTGYRIIPVVALLQPGFSLVPDQSEVAEIFEAPTSYLFDSANHGRGSFERGGRHREFYDINFDGHRIWGATAAILVNFYSKLHDFNYVDLVTSP